jgi:hypothetical protein
VKNEILAIGSTFDWISPTLAIANDLARGPGHTFIIPHDCGWSGYEVRDLLTKFGVETWGLMIISGYITISVPKHRAAWAQTVLGRHGLPIDNPVQPTASKNDAIPDVRTPGREPAPQSSPRRSSDKLENRFDRMANQLERFSWFRNLQDQVSENVG